MKFVCWPCVDAHGVPVFLGVLISTLAAGLALPPVTVTEDGRAAVLAEGVAPVPIGVYAMIFASYPPFGQFKPMAAADWESLVHNGYNAAVSLHFSWADIQPEPPPAALNFSLLTAALDSIDRACATHGRHAGCLPVFLKPYFAKHPEWSYTGPNVTVATVARNALGMRVVVRPTNATTGCDAWNKHIDEAGVEAGRAIPISTDPFWQEQVATLMRGVGQWLEQVDAAASRVRVVHFSGPVMSSLQMRPGPHELFRWLDNSGTDTLGMQWTKASHLSSWKAMARQMAGWGPAFGQRAWAFDFTVLPASRHNTSQLFLDTADQASVFDALAAAHPRGSGAVIAKTESLHVQLWPPSCATCGRWSPQTGQCLFTADPAGQESFASEYNHEPEQIPYQLIGSRVGRHGWENFAALAMKGLASNHSKIPAMFPVETLAKFSMWQDMNVSSPSHAQGTLWAEIWRHEAVHPAGFPSCETAIDLTEQLGAWDQHLRRNFLRVAAPTPAAATAEPASHRWRS
jgi:hypothetical protein